MEKFFSKVFFFCLSFFSSLSALTTSVIIPCNPSNIKYLPAIIESYNNQSVIPNEMIIAISHACKVKKQDIEKINSIYSPYPVKLLPCSYKLYASESKNAACKLASGDIFICHNSNFISIINKIELITKEFENKQIDLLVCYDGDISLLRKVFDKVKWRAIANGEDEQFFQDAIELDFSFGILETPFLNDKN